jgi:superoxide dismutase, Cu-Zn family
MTIRSLLFSLLPCGAMLLFSSSVLAAPKAKPIKVTINQISADGVGESIGTITIKPAKEGVDLAVDLAGLAPGEHGFHLHENGSCDPADKEGKKTAGQAAGGHYDPDATKAHKGPDGGGHKGDMPKLVIPPSGKLKTTLKAPHLSLADVPGRAIMIHAGGDNYADAPKPLGGGGERIACGLVPGAAPAPAPSPPPAPAKKP